MIFLTKTAFLIGAVAMTLVDLPTASAADAQLELKGGACKFLNKAGEALYLNRVTSVVGGTTDKEEKDSKPSDWRVTTWKYPNGDKFYQIDNNSNHQFMAAQKIEGEFKITTSALDLTDKGPADAWSLEQGRNGGFYLKHKVAGLFLNLLVGGDREAILAQQPIDEWTINCSL
jgi:hypothetical protein